MRLICAILLTSAGAAVAEEWRPLDGAGIRAALTGRIVDYEAAWQRFAASGQTLYNAGRDNWGTWRVEGDSYCSKWPPGDAWTCYAVDTDAGGQVRFRGAGSDVTIGRLRD